MATKVQFTGRTERGREVREDSLQACVESVAYVANKDLARVVTASDDKIPDVWYAYATQDALTVDLARGPISSDSPGWFAVITAMRVSS